MNWLKKLFTPEPPPPPPPPPEHWLHVHMIEEKRKVEDRDVLFYLHFYESNRGNRKVELTSSYYDECKASTFLGQMFAYNTKARPWLSGRYDPDIPRYVEVPAVDVANKLSQ